MTIDCGRCETRGIGCTDCAVAVIESPNVTGFLGKAELRALGALADAGMIPPLRLTTAGTKSRPEARTWASRVFPDTRAS
jgi:hypothetical protein